MSATLASRLLDGDLRNEASGTYDELNNAGEGWDCDDDLADWDLVISASNMDEVSVYRDGDDAVLVGDSGGAWAVRVSA